MMSPFADILRIAVEQTPGALGGAFAASDGEIVDSFSRHQDPTDLAILTAHYGVIMAHMQRALLTFHYGHAEVVVMTHGDVDILLHNVGEGYYAILAIGHPAPLARAISNMDACVDELRREMG